jgi:catechol 2,3-dioxygenase-like lactoylglutathione lyase family enzyme
MVGVSMPSLQGLSHLGLSVTDLPAATRFWTEVLDFDMIVESPTFCLLLHREGRVALGMSNHDDTVTGRFDESNVGLDHVALAVRNVDALEAWTHRLDELGISHSGITTSDFGHHVNFRGPDNFPVELFVISAAAAASMGLPSAADAVASSHGGPCPA